LQAYYNNVFFVSQIKTFDQGVFFCYFYCAVTKKEKQKPVTVGFVALGCPKNIVDSERMLAEIVQAGFLITAEPDNADVVVINTCGFIAPAKAEAIEVIKHAVDCKRRGCVKKVIVAGCLSERLGKDLFNQTEGIDAVVGLAWRDKIADVIKRTICSDRTAVYLERSCPKINDKISDDRARLLITPQHWAYLRISEGCNHRCSFCTVPAIRGRFRSKPKDLILAEAAELVSAGAVELNIIAQDTTGYGRDLEMKNGLSNLAKELEKVADLKWIRLMYLYPAGIDDRLIETIAASEKVVPYIDVPIQHIDNKILKDMHRPETKERIWQLIEKLRAALPNIVIRTTVIAGFPGETERQFAELLDFVEWAEFDALGCFRYYPEDGTPAAKMSNQVSDHVKQQRLEELMLTQQKIVFSKNKDRIDTKLICLVDSLDANGSGEGRFYGQAPNIDSLCLIKNCSAHPGTFINVKVIGTRDYDLIVEQI
jgi:ribosomal protein S12 methylthiotransferase